MPPPHCCSLFVLTVVSYFLWLSRSSTQHAATHGQEAAVSFLLDVGASTSLQDLESGYSALHRAFLCCKLSTAAALVRSGASVHTPRDHEVRPRARAILNLRAHAPTPAIGSPALWHATSPPPVACRHCPRVCILRATRLWSCSIVAGAAALSPPRSACHSRPPRLASSTLGVTRPVPVSGGRWRAVNRVPPAPAASRPPGAS